MKAKRNLIYALFLCVLLCACGSSTNSATTNDSTVNKSTENTNVAQTESKESAPKQAESVAWETGEPKAITYTDSIGTKWVQMVCPIHNTGSENLYLSAATMDLEDTDGHLIDSKALISVYPDVLQPGETGYYYNETTLDSGAPDELVLVPHEKVEKAKVDCIRLETSDVTVQSEQYGGVKITGRVENNSDKDVSFVYVTVFLYNSENELLATAFTILTDDLKAGDKIGFSASTISVPDYVTLENVDHYEIYAYPAQMQF